MTNEEVILREGIRSIIMDFRFFLSQLGIVQLNASQFNSGHFMDKYSPLFKKKV